MNCERCGLPLSVSRRMGGKRFCSRLKCRRDRSAAWVAAKRAALRKQKPHPTPPEPPPAYVGNWRLGREWPIHRILELAAGHDGTMR